jgi:hypothetical protein
MEVDSVCIPWSMSLLAVACSLSPALRPCAASEHQAPAPPVPVSLTISDLRTIDDTVRFTITNPTTKTVTAWLVVFGPPTDEGYARGQMARDCYKMRVQSAPVPAGSAPGRPGLGCPLPPGATAQMEGLGADLREARVVGVLFDDGTRQGDVARFLARREAEAKACDKWLAIIDTALASDVEVAVSLLRMKLDAARTSSDENVATELIQQLVARVAEGRNVALRDELKFFADYLGRVRREAMRHLSRATD